ncbi:serine protease inhibitor 3/4-like [Schistocerca piceifrons]|uniref:serine protease inhibitor 3/4-like n=1 Tax=Schistocerca piceifrons TaxID=274613 RepID=UPI001F5F023B|nr:serine protease inhibitor 3/4-like [Schistocerca piceifrons]
MWQTLVKNIPTKRESLFSPLSIQVVLALVYFGAKGNTAKELERGLHLPSDKMVTDNGINALVHRLNESENVLLDIANKIYLLHGFEIKKEFRQTADGFLAGVEQLNFGDSEQSRKTINDWIEDKTHGRIKDIIGKDTLDTYTLMVIVNAIYFKGEWHRVFSEDTTKPAPFHLPSGTTEDVDMMFIEDYFSYADVNELNSQALMLPYKGCRQNMIILLPKKVDGLQYLERNLDRFDPMEVVKRMTSILTGMKNAKFIPDVSVLVGGGLGGFPPIVFKADHPYTFFIVDDFTKTVLFAGRLASPSM